MVKSKKFSWRQLKQIYVTNTKIRTIVGMKKIRNWLGKVRKRDKITKNFSSVQSLSVRERVKNEISSELFEMSDKRFERSFSQQCKNLVKVLIDIIACYWLAIPLLVLEALKFIFPKRKNVSGQLVLVTGAGGGLGRSISLRLADLGCNIAVVDINQETAESVAQKLQKKGVRATAFKADISKYDEIKKLRNDVTNSMGKVDILINNAGLIPNMTTQMGPGFLEKMISVNVLGTIWVKFDIQRRSFKAWFFLYIHQMTRAFIEQMKQGNGGHIVAISSMSGLHPSPFAVDYSATKAAINSFMAGLREKLRLENLDGKIKITTVCPYYITTRQDISDFLNPE